MKKIFLIALPVSLFCMSLASVAHADKSFIAAAVVENTGSAEVVRLVVSPVVREIEEKVICTEGMIRVRLAGIHNRGRETQDIYVPEKGPLKKVRIVEKNPSTTVLQLFPRRNPQNTCSRTTVSAIGGEIIVSVALTDAEVARMNAVPEKVDASASINSAHPSAKAKDDEAANGHPAKKAVENADGEGANAAAAATTELVFKNSGTSKDNDKSPALGAGVLDTPKMAIGFGFAAVVAGFALYLKRKKKSAVSSMGKIEILSTQRLGIRQQLMLVSVQGVKFLLAVGDKSVSSLGVVSDENAGVRQLPAHQPEVPQMSVESTLETLIKEASRRAVKNDLPLEKSDRHSAFDSELRRALDQTAMNTEKPATQSSFDNASNAAGLVALARMRANLKKSTGRSQVFEA